MSHRAQAYVHWILCCQLIRTCTYCFICRTPAAEYVYENELTGIQGVNRFTGVQLLDFALAFQCGLAVEYSSCFISVMDLDLYVCCFDSLVS